MHCFYTQELVWNDDSKTSATGGGESVLFSKPAWQSAITLGKGGRLVPDVASVADPESGVVFIVNGVEEVVGGTSISAPYHSGLLLRMGCGVFATPLIYSAPNTCFHDIVSGNNGYYSATLGFDECSGRGSINGSELLKVVQPPVAPNVPTTLDIFPVVTIGGYLRLGVDQQNVTWVSSDPSVGHVTNGVVTGLKVGRVVITASMGKLTTSMTVIVLNK